MSSRDRSSPDFVSAGVAVEEFLRKKGFTRQIERQGVAEDWSELVGDYVSRVTRVRSVSGPTLVVEVRSSAWLMELNLMKAEILQRVNAELPESPVERIVFVLAERPWEDEAPIA